MAAIKLSKLPDRTPVRLTISLKPELHRALSDYAAAYEREYDQKETVADLIPAMLAGFLESDRDFIRHQRRDQKK